MNSRLQLVDDSQAISHELNSYISEWSMESAGFDYNIVAVFGSQSTGKSTLLNHLFGTSFQVMSESNRSQTTKGIWLCRSSLVSAPLLIMDVEGTDGRERGEDQDFERKSALFSMASSSVLILNMWETQVGLHQGANLGLLKTVMEVNLNMFLSVKSGRRQRTRLLFVIRDFTARTSIENLSNTLKSDLERIWATLQKPDGMQSSLLSDFYDLSFSPLPHKLFQPAEFDQEVKKLRESAFENPNSSDYALLEQYHRRIPADGLSTYMESIWNQVQSNKDLDVPTQQDLLAQFRCDEIASVVTAKFEEVVKPLRRPVELGKVSPTLGLDMQKAKAEALANFDQTASRYSNHVYTKKREELDEKLTNSLAPLFIGTIKNLHKEAVESFSSSLNQLMKSGVAFGSAVSQSKIQILKDFQIKAKALIPENSVWTFKDELELLEEDLGDTAVSRRKEESQKMMTSVQKHFRRKLNEPIEVALSAPSDKMWGKVISAYDSASEDAIHLLHVQAATLSCTSDEISIILQKLERKIWLLFRSTIDTHTTDLILLNCLRTCFEEKFRYDEKGVPRVWTEEDAIDAIFGNARSETLALLPLFSTISPPSDYKLLIPAPVEDEEEDEDDLEGTTDPLEVFGEARKLKLAAAFRRDADAYYVEAKRGLVGNTARIPVWMYGVVAILGWNEFWAVLTNPLYFVMLLCLAAGAVVVVQLNMVGPLFTMASVIGNELQKAGAAKLREVLAAPIEQVHQAQESLHSKKPAREKSGNQEEAYEMKSL